MGSHRSPGTGPVVAGGVAGLLAGAAAAEAVAALLTGVTSPLFAVANRAVDAAPRPVKEWAIETFGTADKPVLIGGVVATVAVLAVVAEPWAPAAHASPSARSWCSARSRPPRH